LEEQGFRRFLRWEAATEAVNIMVLLPGGDLDGGGVPTEDEPEDMKRKSASLLLGVTLACVVAYLAWWGRQFYVCPELVMDHRIPPEAEKVVLEWYEQSGGIPPVPLTFPTFRDAIRSPWGPAVSKAAVILESPTEVRVIHYGRVWWFSLEDGVWKTYSVRP
jgi:hypothetical protein